MKKILTFSSIVLFLSLGINHLTVSAADHVFADDGTTPSWEWARDSIYQAYEEGIIEGKGDNLFDAEGVVTRAEAAAMLVNWKHINPEDFADTCEIFTDVADDKWYTPYINAAYENGLVAGKGDGLFDPEGYLTRAEAATLIVKGCGWIPDAPASEFTDVPEDWYTPYINTAYAYNIISGMGNGLCKPLEEVSRAQFVVMLDNIWKTAEEAKELYMQHFYDENNQLQETVYYHADDNVSYLRHKYSYDTDGLLIEVAKTYESGNGNSTITYAYNEDGKIISERTKKANNDYLSAEYTYDTQGNLTTKKENFSWGDYTIYSYDSSGRKVQTQSYDEQNNLEKTLQHMYDKDNSTVTTVELSGNGTDTQIVSKSFYNDMGELSAEEYYDENGILTQIYRYTYDEQNRLIQLASYNGKGKVTFSDFRWVYEYDLSGRCIMESLYNEDLTDPTF